MAIFLACLGVLAVSTAASAHDNSVVGTAVCTNGGTSFAITWVVTNDWNVSETATATAATGGLATVSGSPVTIAASGNGSGGAGVQPFATGTLTQTLPTSSGTSATLTISSVWADGFTGPDSGVATFPAGGCGAPPPTQTLAGHIYLCGSSNTPTTTEVPNGTLGATGPQTVSTVPNPLATQPVGAGTYVMTATAPTGYSLVVCGGSSTPSSNGQSATESVPVPAGLSGTGIFYVEQVSFVAPVPITTTTPVVPSTTTTPVVPAAVTTMTPVALTTSTTPASAADENLAFTGFDSELTGALGVLLVLLGAVVLAAGRRRQAHEAR